MKLDDNKFPILHPSSILDGRINVCFLSVLQLATGHAVVPQSLDNSDNAATHPPSLILPSVPLLAADPHGKKSRLTRKPS